MSDMSDEQGSLPKVGDRFAVVMRIERGNPQSRQSIARVKHATPHAARVEAERLAQANPGVKFAVLGVIAVHVAKGERRRVKARK